MFNHVDDQSPSGRSANTKRSLLKRWFSLAVSFLARLITRS